MAATPGQSEPAVPATRASAAAALVGAGILLSRVIGLVRERVLAIYFGTGLHADVWSAGLRLPNVLQNLLESDVERLHVLITRHAKLTGSKRAEEILANWKTWLPKFRKVMPVEYRRALRELKAKTDAEPKIAIGA